MWRFFVINYKKCHRITEKKGIKFGSFGNEICVYCLYNFLNEEIEKLCIQSEFWNDRKADEGEGHKNADVFRYTMCLEGIVQRLSINSFP